MNKDSTNKDYKNQVKHSQSIQDLTESKTTKMKNSFLIKQDLKFKEFIQKNIIIEHEKERRRGGDKWWNEENKINNKDWKTYIKKELAI